MNKTQITKKVQSIIEDTLDVKALPAPYRIGISALKKRFIELLTPHVLGKKWYSKDHRPPQSKDDITFSISVLMCQNINGPLHTVGWFDFESQKWEYLGDE